MPTHTALTPGVYGKNAPLVDPQVVELDLVQLEVGFGQAGQGLHDFHQSLPVSRGMAPEPSRVLDILGWTGAVARIPRLCP